MVMSNLQVLHAALTHAHTHIYVHICTHTHTCMRIYTDAHTHMHIPLHTPVLSSCNWLIVKFRSYCQHLYVTRIYLPTIVHSIYTCVCVVFNNNYALTKTCRFTHMKNVLVTKINSRQYIKTNIFNRGVYFIRTYNVFRFGGSWGFFLTHCVSRLCFHFRIVFLFLMSASGLLCPPRSWIWLWWALRLWE